MDDRFVIDTKENKQYLAGLRDELLHFGRRFPSPGGGSYYLGDDGTPWIDRPRETWITCRMAHVYSIGSMLGNRWCEELATAAVKGLLGELKDNRAGGWYAGLKADNTVLYGKQCYAHAFVILAATSAVLAHIDGAEELLEDALYVYDDKFWNESEGLAADNWDTDFTELDSYRGLNANMHTVEAFLAVADATGDERYRNRAKRIIDRVIGWANAYDMRIPEHFNSEWIPEPECNRDNPADQFKPYGATPGHGIEWARLISQWAVSVYCGDDEHEAQGMYEAANDNEYRSYISAAEGLYNRAVEDAWNADGEPGIVYTTDWNGKPVVHDRMHWTLAEAINTSAVLYRITGKQKYAGDYADFVRYLEEKVHDKVNGSWFHQLDEHNNLLDTVWPGKSDIYHAFQATLIPYATVGMSIAADISRHKR